jgi:hypothetical protein
MVDGPLKAKNLVTTLQEVLCLLSMEDYKLNCQKNVSLIRYFEQSLRRVLS